VGKILLRVIQGNESSGRRLRALLHTWLGAYLALLLKDKDIEHIHVHHGYFASWVGMVAADLLGINYSMTLHGSDLLLHAAYLDIKLEHCSVCFTVSEFNRNYILEHYPRIPARKVIVARIGVNIPFAQSPSTHALKQLRMLSVGRLHFVKDHAFLIRACRILKDRGCSFCCVIAGDGPERTTLAKLIRRLDLENEIKLAGHVPNEKLDAYYNDSDLVVLTSRSEGIPLVLMEAMARGKIVLAPAITGIPELVDPGKSGFLYLPGSVRDFVRTVETIGTSLFQLESVRRRARAQVEQHFNREKNLAAFAQLFAAQLPARPEAQDEDPVLQQI
jgi:glycosyltransferase involved in cell wall biosynthesis